MLTSPIKSTLNKRRSFFPYSCCSCLFSVFFRNFRFFFSFAVVLYVVSFFFFLFSSFRKRAFLRPCCSSVKKKKRRKAACMQRLLQFTIEHDALTLEYHQLLKARSFFPSLFIHPPFPSLIITVVLFFFFLTDSFLHIHEKTVCGEWEPRTKKKKKEKEGTLSNLGYFLVLTASFHGVVLFLSLFFFF